MDELSAQTSGPSPHQVEIHEDPVWKIYIDDVNGGVLDTKLTEEARKLEMDWLLKEKVYQKVLKSICAKEGISPIPLKWIDTNKGDMDKPFMRSRLVVRECTKGKHAKFAAMSPEQLFSAMPWLEALKLLVSLKMSLQKSRRGKELKIGIWDISRAHFMPEAKRRIYVQLLEGDPDRDTHVGLLLRSMYGTQDASNLWQKDYTELIRTDEYVPGKSNPAIFHSEQQDGRLYVHGDDFVLLADQESIDRMDKLLNSKYTCKKLANLGFDRTDDKETCILNRIVRVVDDPARPAMEIEGDLRHVQLLVREFGLENAKGVNTPRVKRTADEV